MFHFASYILMLVFYRFVLCSQTQKCGSEGQCLCRYEGYGKQELAITHCNAVTRLEIPSFCQKSSYKGVRISPTYIGTKTYLTNQTILIDVEEATKISDNFTVEKTPGYWFDVFLHLKIDGATKLKNIKAISKAFRRRQQTLAGIAIRNSPLINLAEVHDLIWQDTSK